MSGVLIFDEEPGTPQVVTPNGSDDLLVLVSGTPGAPGPEGPVGPAGAKGDTGDRGPTGAQGPKGDTGAAGAAGAQGPAGADGPTGAQGPKGDKGDKGDTGPAGATGAAGAQGPKGDAGATGAQGPKGDAGPQGPQGEPGPQGVAGATGAAGAAGVGVPVGGTTGQVLAKRSATDFDTQWVAAATGGSGGAAATTYKGAWTSGTTYQPNDTAVDQSALWRAVNPTVGVAPVLPYDSYAGGSSTLGGGLGGAAITQQFTFASADTFTSIRVGLAEPGTCRVGFSTTKPTNSGEVTWLSYADVSRSSSGSAWVQATLSTPVTVAAGQTLWFVWTLTTGTVNTFTPTGTSVSGMVGGVTIAASSAFWAASSGAAWGGTGLNLAVNAQLVKSVVTWEKVTDLPDTSSLATAASVTAKADKTAYKGAWSAATTYVKNDAVTNANALWQAINPTLGTAPDATVTDNYLVGSDATPTNTALSFTGVQEWTFAAAQTFTKLRAQTLVGSGSTRVGFMTSRPASTISYVTRDNFTWVAYADYASSNSNAAFGLPQALNTALTVAAGQKLWLVFVSTGSYIGVESNGARVGGLTIGTPAYSSSGWVDTNANTMLKVQLDLPTQAWAKIVDLPDTSAIATLNVTKADKQARTVATKTTAVLADGATETGAIPIAAGYRLYRLQTSVPARVRLYDTAVHRDADLSRVAGVTPLGDHGLMLEYATTSTVATPDFALGAWSTSVAAAPGNVNNAASAAIDGKIYIAGGFDGNTFTTALRIYDPATNTWATKTPMPTAGRRGFMGCGTINGKFYIAGGSTTGGDVASVNEYDPTTDTWATKAAMPNAKSGSAFTNTAIDGKLYVVGIGASSYNATLHAFDPVANTWTAKAAPPVPLNSYGAAVIGTKLYVVGGYTTGNGQLNTLYEYDTVTDTWATKANAPAASAQSAVVAQGRRLYVLGPLPGGDPPKTVWIWDQATNAWSTGPDMPNERGYAAAASVNGTIYALGGTTASISLSRADGIKIAAPLTAYAATLTPVVDGMSLEASPSANIPITITNLSGSTAPVTVTLTYLRTE